MRYGLARMETIERVATAYVRLSQLRDVQRAQQERVVALREQHTELTALLAEGRVADVELLRIAEVLLTAETDLRKTRNDVTFMLLDLSGELDLPGVLHLDDVALIEPAETDRPDVESGMNGTVSPRIELARKSLEAAQFSAREAERSFLPAVELFAAERLRSGRDFAFDDELYGGVRVTMPLFQPRAQVQRQIEQATVRQREAALDWAEREYETAAVDLANRETEALERAVATEARVRRLEETYRIDAVLQQEGRLTLSDLLDTEARLAATRSELAASRAEVLIIRLNRSVLTGTLTPSTALYLTGMNR